MKPHWNVNYNLDETRSIYLLDYLLINNLSIKVIICNNDINSLNWDCFCSGEIATTQQVFIIKLFPVFVAFLLNYRKIMKVKLISWDNNPHASAINGRSTEVPHDRLDYGIKVFIRLVVFWKMSHRQNSNKLFNFVDLDVFKLL